MHNSNFFSFIGFLKPIEISILTSKLSNSMLLNKQVTSTSLLTISLREIPFSISKEAIIPFGSINSKTILQENYNLIYAAKIALQGKDGISSNFSIKENDLMEEETFDSSLIFQRNPFVANLSYLKNYTHKYKTIIKHHFFKLFIKKINKFKYIFKKPFTQTLTAKFVCGLSIQLTHNIKNFINLLNLKIVQVLIFFREFFLIEQIPIKIHWLKKDIVSHDNMYMRQTSFPTGEEKVAKVPQKIFFKFSKIKQVFQMFLKCLSRKYAAQSFFLTITNSSWCLPTDPACNRKTKLNKPKPYLKFFSAVFYLLERVCQRRTSNQSWSFSPSGILISHAPLPLQAYKLMTLPYLYPQGGTLLAVSHGLITRREPLWQLPINCLKNLNVHSSWKYTYTTLKLHLTTFFFHFKNLLIHFMLCLKKILNKILWKYSKKYKKNITYSQYLQKYRIFIEKIDYFYTFDIFV